MINQKLEIMWQFLKCHLNSPVNAMKLLLIGNEFPILPAQEMGTIIFTGFEFLALYFFVEFF
jgi:hypothetical protein